MQAIIDIKESTLIKFATKTQSSEKGILFWLSNIIYFLNFSFLKVFRPLFRWSLENHHRNEKKKKEYPGIFFHYCMYTNVNYFYL